MSEDTFERAVSISQDEIDKWCAKNGDHNPLHDSEAAEDSVFGKTVVPGMMLLDKLSGLLNNFGESTTILTGVTACRFRDPALPGEVLTYTASVSNETPNYDSIEFKIRARERGSLVAHGSVQITHE